jgi:hypothetical protein
MPQENPLQDRETKSETSQSRATAPKLFRLPKTHEDYWKRRLKRRTYTTAEGGTRVVPEWQVQLCKDGQQRWVNLETSNKEVAAKKARDTWARLRAEGWQGLRSANPGRSVPGSYMGNLGAHLQMCPPK